MCVARNMKAGNPLLSVSRLAFRLALLAGFAAVAPSAFAFPVDTKAREAYLVDYETGTVLYDKNGDVPMPPSSMSKLMTTAMVFERLKEGSLSFDDVFRVSQTAWRKGGAASGGSTMFLAPNSEVRVEDLLRGVIIQSGNDACIALAENLMGTEEAFASAMNKKAKEIGLTGSYFMNSTGLPDEGHVMTPRDLAVLAKYLIRHFPEYYSMYAEKEFTHNKIRQQNRNPLLYTMTGADGLKTGHTSAAGYGLTASAQRGDRRLILVINGLKSMQERADEANRLMDWGFANFENRTLFVAGDAVSSADVWLGEQEIVPLAVAQDVRLTLPRRASRNLEMKAVFTGPVPAPVQKGQPVGTLRISGTDMAQAIEIPLVAAADVQKLGLFGRIGAAINHMLFGAAHKDDGETVLTVSAKS
ncbi:D-alanyl-D-alanine carboxypeptidase family protein [Haematospirillum jordaniae]|uniref:D-alanyl-D-alanine carboxypeptidase family protein n=1 Tax=Haematospirillum jordaniae TaxID=1549855 RepID=UPI000A41024F|nr:D-alanyl-D-alanine carboxypeptidase family protein [Haematospirillum jordaniae]